MVVKRGGGMQHHSEWDGDRECEENEIPAWEQCWMRRNRVKQETTE